MGAEPGPAAGLIAGAAVAGRLVLSPLGPGLVWLDATRFLLGVLIGGLGSLVWVYAAEGYPEHLRGLGASMLLLPNLVANFLMSQSSSVPSVRWAARPPLRSCSPSPPGRGCSRGRAPGDP